MGLGSLLDIIELPRSLTSEKNNNGHGLGFREILWKQPMKKLVKNYAFHPLQDLLDLGERDILCDSCHSRYDLV